jgi:hypothetical protein
LAGQRAAFASIAVHPPAGVSAAPSSRTIVVASGDRSTVTRFASPGEAVKRRACPPSAVTRAAWADGTATSVTAIAASAPYERRRIMPP